MRDLEDPGLDFISATNASPWPIDASSESLPLVDYERLEIALPATTQRCDEGFLTRLPDTLSPCPHDMIAHPKVEAGFINDADFSSNRYNSREFRCSKSPSCHYCVAAGMECTCIRSSLTYLSYFPHLSSTRQPDGYKTGNWQRVPRDTV